MARRSDPERRARRRFGARFARQYDCTDETAARGSCVGSSAAGKRARMKTILVPTEQNTSMLSALDAALLLARKFSSCIEGFPLRPAVADMIAIDPDAGL